MSSIIPVNLVSAATNPFYFDTLITTNVSNPDKIQFLSYNSNFTDNVLGPNATARLVHNLDWAAFHEMGAYNLATDSLYVTSNWVGNLSNPINVTIVDMSSPDFPISSTRYENQAEANGGTNWFPPGTNSSTNATPPNLLICDQGDFDAYSKLISVDPTTNESTVVVNNFLGRNFSSVNDVRQHPVSGDLWFTDADYGIFQGFREPSEVPKQVYRFNPTTGDIRVVADGFDQPNGLEFSPDLKTLYVTDTGYFEFGVNKTRPATIYAYDVSEDSKSLSGRRVFAYVDNGFPDGIHTDTDGNVWAGCGDGIHVWSPDGTLIGKVWNGVLSNNFAFLDQNRVMVFSNKQLWILEGLKAQGREVCRDFGEDRC